MCAVLLGELQAGTIPGIVVGRYKIHLYFVCTTFRYLFMIKARKVQTYTGLSVYTAVRNYLQMPWVKVVSHYTGAKIHLQLPWITVVSNYADTNQKVYKVCISCLSRNFLHQ